MTLFLLFFYKLIPLYGMILLWFIAWKKMWVQKESIASLLLYIIAPVVIFYWVFTVDLNWVNLSVPFLFFILCCAISLLFLLIGKKVLWNDSRKNILAFTAGTWNTGYFGLPVVFAILWEGAFSIAVMAILWFVLYENTLGFYLTAKWNYSTKESIQKVIKLPIIYAFALWLLLNVLNIDFWQSLDTTITTFKWWYTLLWMMIIWMWLAGISLKNVDYKFISLTVLSKFIIWPLVVFFIIFLDKAYFNIYSEIYAVLIIMSIVPLAANTVALATELKVHPEMASLSVFLSTLIALFYIPLFTIIFNLSNI